jgi:V/A-type H+/Na+-transporting ATPase subunit D
VALGAARVLDDELAATRFRLRAVQDRWIPRLETAASALDLALAEAEGADAVRLRLAAGDGPRGRAADAPARSRPRDGGPR